MPGSQLPNLCQAQKLISVDGLDMSDQAESSEKPEGTSGDAPKIVPRQKAVSDAVVSAVLKTDETVLRLDR